MEDTPRAQTKKAAETVTSTDGDRLERCPYTLTCKTVVHFRGLVVIVVVSRHYSGVLHVIVGLGALWGGLLGACITENHCPSDGLPWRLGGPIIVT